jgi:tetratricopeptide (TPR) repeat protein
VIIRRKYILLVFSIFFSGLFISPARAERTVSESEVKHHLRVAEEAYRKAVDLDQSDPESARQHYSKAIMHYEWIVDQGDIHNGKLYYNIGNAYFRLGDIGRAILNYRRASLYVSNDQNLERNLDYARSRRVDKPESKESQKVFRTIFFLHYDLPFRIRGVIFVISFALIWVLAVLYLFWRRSGVRVGIMLVSVVCVLFLASLTVELVNRSRSPAGVILAEEVVARKGDAETYQPSFTEPLHSGTEYTMVEKRGEWWHIELANGERCWIHANAGELVRK